MQQLTGLWLTQSSQFHSPPLSSVSPGTSFPFLLRIIIRTKSLADATPSIAKLPLLPMEESSKESIRRLGFRVKRLTRNSMFTAFGLCENDLMSSIPAQVLWSNAHSAVSAATCSSPNLEEREGTSEPIVLGPTHSWTPCAHDASAPSFPYYTTALLSGLISFPISPSFQLPTLRVTYTLHLRIPLVGLGNNLDEQLCVLEASSGVTAAQLAAIGSAEATRRAMGTRGAEMLRSIDRIQGDAEEWQKLDELALLPAYDAENEDAWSLEEKWSKGKGESLELPGYDDVADGLQKASLLADEKQ